MSGPNGFFVEQSAVDGFELPADAADGTYKWELRQLLQLSDAARAQDRATAVVPEGEVQSGAFLVRDARHPVRPGGDRGGLRAS